MINTPSPQKQHRPEELEALYQKPHVQAWVRAVKWGADGAILRGYDRDHCAIREYPTDRLMRRWKQKEFSLKLYNNTFCGVFDELDARDYAYHGYLEHNEILPAFKIECPRSAGWTLHGIPIQEGNFVFEDEYGWRFYLSITEEHLYIGGHIACFDLVQESASRPKPRTRKSALA